MKLTFVPALCLLVWLAGAESPVQQQLTRLSELRKQVKAAGLLQIVHVSKLASLHCLPETPI
jgi:hypothetical protein